MHRCIVAVCALLLVACSGDGDSTRPVGQGAAAAQILSWPYWATSMRIHPLTRIATERTSGDLVIETRLEFTDRDGVTARYVGRTIIDLYATRGANSREPRKQWEIDLRTLADNANHFDVVTRTYLFKLKIDASDVAEPTQLRVHADGIDGRSYTDRLDIPAWNAR